MLDRPRSDRRNWRAIRRTNIAAVLGSVAAIGLCALSALPLPVRAQALALDAPVDLGEIVVQARRRDEKIIDAPVAVTVETGDQLKDQNAVLFDDVARLVPNVRMMPSPQSVSAMDVTMRGQTAIRSAIDYDPAVGIYVDGVYVANGQAAMNSLLDIDTVEIVRGAQGTLFGRNNTGGSISFNTNRPQLGAFGAEATAQLGSDHLFVGRGIVNVPVSDTLALRLAYQNNQRDGFGTSVGSGQGNFENQHRFQARLGALWRPSSLFDAYWTYEHFEANEVGALLHPLHGTSVEQLGQLYNQIPGLSQQIPNTGLTAVAPVLIPDNFYQTGAGYPAHDNTSLDATQLTLTGSLDATTKAKLILGYRRLRNDTAIDVDASTLPFADTLLQNSSGQKSAELQLSGIALDKSLDWVAGLYWFRDDGAAPSVLQASPTAYIADYAILQNAPFNLLPPGNPPFSPYTVYESNTVQNLSHAAFVHGEYHLAERWSAAAGLRRTDDTRKVSENSYADIPGLGQSCTIIDQTTGGPANNGGPCPPIDKSASFSYWSWEFSTRYRMSDETNAYFRTGRGQRSGGWNVPVNTLQDQPFNPEQITDFELGMKADLLGGGLMINGDVFLGNYDQMQRLLPQVVGGTPTTYVINAGKARVSGAELETDLRLSRRWSLRADVGWTDAKYRQFQYFGADLSGNQFYQTPRFNAGLGAGYETALAGGLVRVHADYAWQDAVQFSVINDFNRQGATGTFNLRAAYVGGEGAWELAAFGTNLGSQQYAVTGGSITLPGPGQTFVPAISWQIPAVPREYGAEFTYRFGARR